jgi:hypothetical protein
MNLRTRPGGEDGPGTDTPGSSPARAVRMVSIALVLTLVLSSAVGGAQTWSNLRGEHERWRDADRASVRHAPAAAAGHQGEVFDFFAARVDRDDRYYLHTRPMGADASPEERTSPFLLARYYLLPAVNVTDPADATVVLAYGEDPATLELDFGEIEWAPEPLEAAVARTR